MLINYELSFYSLCLREGDGVSEFWDWVVWAWVMLAVVLSKSAYEFCGFCLHAVQYSRMRSWRHVDIVIISRKLPYIVYCWYSHIADIQFLVTSYLLLG